MIFEHTFKPLCNQISDLHLSAFHDSSRISEFKEFCGPTLDVIRPSVVLATGIFLYVHRTITTQRIKKLRFQRPCSDVHIH